VVDYPNVAADERTMLEQFLDYHRHGVLAALADVSDVDAGRELLPASRLTIGGIVKHLGHVEDLWFQQKLLGLPKPEPWASRGRRVRATRQPGRAAFVRWRPGQPTVDLHAHD
jgi:hypothetical protein